MKYSLHRTMCVLLVSILVFCALTACGKKAPEEVRRQAAVGEALSTMFFDFTVNTAQRVENYKDYTASKPDTVLVLVNVTLTNTTKEPVTMYDSDFTLAYGDGAQDFAWIYDAFADQMQPAEDTIKAGESRTYDLLFPVPQGKTALALCYTETYEDEAGEKVDGNLFRVTVTV